MTSTLPMRCKCRRQAVTTLRCARCSVSICPDCSQMYPAGMLCNACSGRGRPFVHQIKFDLWLRSTLLSLAASVLCGWGLASVVGFGLMGGLWGGLLQGIVVSEVSLRTSGRKHGPMMEATVGVCVGLGVIAGWFLHGLGDENLSGLQWLFFHLTHPWSVMLLLFAIAVGVYRTRSL